MLYPKILIVSRLNWDDNSNSNTLTNLFDGYDPDRIARIYIETKKPNTKCCHHFFQISEISLIQKLYKWRTPTGMVLDTDKTYDLSKDQERKEDNLMSFARHHRSSVLTLMRDVLWSFGGWKSPELKSFICDFNPDLVWLDGSPLILMNRLNNYVCAVANKPSCTFLMDDVYTYKSCTSLFGRIYKFFLRRQVKKTVENASHVFVASEKMKCEYDGIFSIDSTFLAKGFLSNGGQLNSKEISSPIKFVYLGNVLIGRLESLILLAEAIHRINSGGDKRFELFVYTGDFVSEKDKKRLVLDESIHLCPSVPYSEVPKIMSDNDVVVFVEALTGKANRIARLSFSTKIVDYISSGKCIFTIGPSDSAPVEYLKEHEISIVANSEEEIFQKLETINMPLLNEFMERIKRFAQTNHDKNKIQKALYQKLQAIALSKKNNNEEKTLCHNHY